MFFWGSFNFASNSKARDDGELVIPFPMFVPPSVEMTTGAAAVTAAPAPSSSSTPNDEASARVDALLRTPPLSIKSVSCGVRHCLVLANAKAKGGGETAAPALPPVLYGIGGNHHRQLSRKVAGTHAASLTRIDTSGFFDGSIAKVCCGAHFSLLLTEAGDVYACGENHYGQLGLTPQQLRPFVQQHQQAGGGRGGNTAAAAADDHEKTDGQLVPDFTMVSSLVFIRDIAVSGSGCGNSCFAINQKGEVFSWGEGQLGHLGHGERLYNIVTNRHQADIINQSEYPDRFMRSVCQRQPKRIEFFAQKNIKVDTIAVGKAHFIVKTVPIGGSRAGQASSSSSSSWGGDVYCCGDGSFGKCGNYSTDLCSEPTRVRFPADEDRGSGASHELVSAVAAGDDYSLVVRESPGLGSVLYYFGRVGMHDAQVVPMVIPFTFPGASPLERCVTRVWGGRGRQCAALVQDRQQQHHHHHDNNVLYVWGNSGDANLRNGTLTSGGGKAGDGNPQPVALISEKFYNVNRFAFGGTFIVVGSDDLRLRSPPPQPHDGGAVKEEHESENEEEGEGRQEEAERDSSNRNHGFDIVVPHQDRLRLFLANNNGYSGKALYENINPQTLKAAYESIVFHDGDMKIPVPQEPKKEEEKSAGEAAGDGVNEPAALVAVTGDNMIAFRHERGVYAFLTQYYEAADDEIKNSRHSGASSGKYVGVAERYMRGIPIADAPEVKKKNNIYKYLADVAQTAQSRQTHQQPQGQGHGDENEEERRDEGGEECDTRLLFPPGTRRHVRELRVGDKVRLWMTDVYALGTVSRTCHGAGGRHHRAGSVSVSGSRQPSVPPSPRVVALGAPGSRNASTMRVVGSQGSNADGVLSQSPSRQPPLNTSAGDGDAESHRVVIQWLRDDWNEEELSLYTDDETFDSDNENRWQPIWFEKEFAEKTDDDLSGNYVFERRANKPKKR